jgi:hypothetical protein
MDVDEEVEEGDSTQQFKRVPDYGIEVDFEILGADEREVSVSAVPACYDMQRPFVLCDDFGINVERLW